MMIDTSLVGPAEPLIGSGNPYNSGMTQRDGSIALPGAARAGQRLRRALEALPGARLGRS
jgi:hypothetical protein